MFFDFFYIIIIKNIIAKLDMGLSHSNLVTSILYPRSSSEMNAHGLTIL